MLRRWLGLYHDVTRKNGAEADAGRYLLSWFQQAGLADVTITTSSWSYADRGARAFWGNGWIERATESDFATQAVEYGLASRDELVAISHAWKWWRDQPDGYLAMMHTEALAIAE